jgi:hypothetical protein
MKKNHFIALAIFLISAGYFSCSSEDGCEKFSDNIVGRWKLIESSCSLNNSQPETTDHSKENIIFDFQENNKLVITGPIPNDRIDFYYFQAGYYWYGFSSPNCGECGCDPPDTNLSTDWDDMVFSHYCRPSFDEKTMEISGHIDTCCGEKDDNGLAEIFVYNWVKKFIKIK